MKRKLKLTFWNFASTALLLSPAPPPRPPTFVSLELGTTHFRWDYFDDKLVLEQRVGLLVEMETREEEETDKGTVGAEWEDRERSAGMRANARW